MTQLTMELPDIEIPEEDHNVMATMLGRKEEDPLPDIVRVHYLAMKVLADRANMPVSTHQLLLTVMMAVDINHVTPDPPTILSAWEDGSIKAGDTVYCKWRNIKAKPGELVAIGNDRRPVIRFKGDSEDRKLDAEDVRLTK